MGVFGKHGKMPRLKFWLFWII